MNSEVESLRNEVKRLERRLAFYKKFVEYYRQVVCGLGEYIALLEQERAR